MKASELVERLEAIFNEHETELAQQLQAAVNRDGRTAVYDQISLAIYPLKQKILRALRAGEVAVPKSWQEEAIDEICAAAPAVAQEPVAWRHPAASGWMLTHTKHMDSSPLYAAPQSAPMEERRIEFGPCGDCLSSVNCHAIGYCRHHCFPPRPGERMAARQLAKEIADKKLTAPTRNRGEQA